MNLSWELFCFSLRISSHDPQPGGGYLGPFDVEEVSRRQSDSGYGEMAGLSHGERSARNESISLRRRPELSPDDPLLDD